MRVYLPMSVEELSRLAAGSSIHVTTAWTVTDSLLEAYGIDPGDDDIGEAVAMALAAAASRTQVAPVQPWPRRLVVAADFAPEQLKHADEPGTVRPRVPLGRRDMVSVHIDAAPYAVPAPDELDDVTDLQWYDAGELEQVLAMIEAADAEEGN